MYYKTSKSNKNNLWEQDEEIYYILIHIINMYYKTSKSNKNNLWEQDQEIEADLPFFEAQAIVLVRVKRPKILITKNEI